MFIKETSNHDQPDTISVSVWKKDLAVRYRLPMLMLGFLSLLSGLAAGVSRLGVNLPLPSPELMLIHGPLMVSGFFGTLINLERAVAVSQRWAYSGPALSALGVVMLLTAQLNAGAWLLVLGSLGLVVSSYSVYRRQQAVFTATLLLGALSWLSGNVLWLTGFTMAQIVPWWMGFLVLTIAGERLELSRFLPRSILAQRLFVVVMGILISGIILAIWKPQVGQILLSISFVLLSLWLLCYDIAGQTIHSRGLTRFIAVCLFSGYAWLLLGGMVGLASGGLVTGLVYDAILHAVFLGFVFAMVFGHAPIIFPAVTGLNIHYHPVFYTQLVLLHASLLLRVSADFLGQYELRTMAGSINAMTLVIFILNTVAAVIRGRHAMRQ